MIRVGVVGAAGRMGRETCRAVAAEPGLDVVAAIDPQAAGEVLEGVTVAGTPEALAAAQASVAVDFTRADAAMGTARWAIEHGVHIVVGTSGLTPEDLDELRELTAAGGANAMVVPNFAIGAVLMMRFAAEASRFLPAAEVIELHHDGKVDAPSGTALATARAIAAAREASDPAPGGDDAHPGARGADVEGVRVHAVRLPGLVAHQEVLLGGQGQTLSIRHDTVDRSAFMPGVLLAVRAVGARPGLTVGLEPLLGRA